MNFKTWGWIALIGLASIAPASAVENTGPIVLDGKTLSFDREFLDSTECTNTHMEQVPSVCTRDVVTGTDRVCTTTTNPNCSSSYQCRDVNERVCTRDSQTGAETCSDRTRQECSNVQTCAPVETTTCGDVPRHGTETYSCTEWREVTDYCGISHYNRVKVHVDVDAPPGGVEPEEILAFEWNGTTPALQLKEVSSSGRLALLVVSRDSKPGVAVLRKEDRVTEYQYEVKYHLRAVDIRDWSERMKAALDGAKIEDGSAVLSGVPETLPLEGIAWVAEARRYRFLRSPKTAFAGTIGFVDSRLDLGAAFPLKPGKKYDLLVQAVFDRQRLLNPSVAPRLSAVTERKRIRLK